MCVPKESSVTFKEVRMLGSHFRVEAKEEETKKGPWQIKEVECNN